MIEITTLIYRANQWTGFYVWDLHHERVNHYQYIVRKRVPAPLFKAPTP